MHAFLPYFTKAVTAVQAELAAQAASQAPSTSSGKTLPGWYKRAADRVAMGRKMVQAASSRSPSGGPGATVRSGEGSGEVSSAGVNGVDVSTADSVVQAQ